MMMIERNANAHDDVEIGKARVGVPGTIASCYLIMF
jgi:hypothetical protein